MEREKEKRTKKSYIVISLLSKEDWLQETENASFERTRLIRARNSQTVFAINGLLKREGSFLIAPGMFLYIDRSTPLSPQQRTLFHPHTVYLCFFLSVSLLNTFLVLVAVVVSLLFIIFLCYFRLWYVYIYIRYVYIYMCIYMYVFVIVEMYISLLLCWQKIVVSAFFDLSFL